MKQLVIFVGPRGFETAWKERGDEAVYELVVVDAARHLVDTVVAVDVPEWYTNLDAMVADGVRALTWDP